VSSLPASFARTADNRLLARLTLVVIVILSLPFGTLQALAKAPPHATTLISATARVEPSESAQAAGTIPAGTEVELTGHAAPGFLSVYYDGQVVWVPGQDLTLGGHPGIETADAARDTPLRLAPTPDGEVVGIVPAGETVILTGAQIDGYLAGSYNGTGGWLDANDLVR
jgi:hypothetical protein